VSVWRLGRTGKRGAAGVRTGDGCCDAAGHDALVARFYDVSKAMTRSAQDLDDVSDHRASARPEPVLGPVLAEFEALYRGCYRDVYRYVLALTRSADDADDISAETFERAYGAWTDGRVPLDRPLPWLLLTARRIATDRWRRLRRFASLAPSASKVREIDDAGEGRTEFWLWFDALARALSAHQREVLLLRYQRDLTDNDIASIMGITPSGVRSLVARALAVLREHPELVS
jgi:RNA polymerase sigma-70 factor (ECF subfamily)